MFLLSFIDEGEGVTDDWLNNGPPSGGYRNVVVAIEMWCGLVKGVYHLFPFDLGRKYFYNRNSI